MFKIIKDELVKDIIYQKGEKSEKIIYDKLERALERVSKDIVYKHLIFQENVTYDKFLDMLKDLI